MALSHFLSHHWKFDDRNTVALFDSLSEDDRKIFNFNVTDIDWPEYILVWCLGLRKYFVKDGLNGTIYGRKKQTVLKIVTFIMMPLYFYGLFKIVYCVFYYLFVLFNLLFK